MVFEIVWTEHARTDFQNILIYLESEWSQQIAEKFVTIFYQKVDLVAAFPFVGVASSKDKSIRKILITKQNALYYQLIGNRIVLLNIFDTRQNPNKNLF